MPETLLGFLLGLLGSAALGGLTIGRTQAVHGRDIAHLREGIDRVESAMQEQGKELAAIRRVAERALGTRREGAE